MDVANYVADWEGVILILAFIAFDLVTGIIKAVATRTMSSTALRQGLAHKLGYLIIAFLALFVDAAQLHFELGYQIPLFGVCAIAIIVIEITSVLENISIIVPGLEETPLFRIFQVTDEKEKEGNHVKRC